MSPRGDAARGDRPPSKLLHHGLSAGRPDPLGATWDGEAINSIHDGKNDLKLFKIQH